MNRIFIYILSILFTVNGVALFADQTVVFKNPQTAQIGQISGSIEQYNRDGLLLRTLGGQIKTLPIDSIVEIQSETLPVYDEALSKLQQEQYDQAEQLLEKAFIQTTEDWKKQEILAKQVEIFHRTGDFQSAMGKYIQLTQKYPQTAYFDRVPLVWISSSPSPKAIETARRCMTQQNQPFLALMGASQLLSTDKKSAQLTLNILRQSEDSVVSTLAQMQIHRLSLTPLPVPELKKLELLIDNLPKSLQYGPRFVLAQLWSRSSVEKSTKIDKISMSYLRSSMNPHAPFDLQARCLYSAGSCLLEAGYKDEAYRIFSHLIQKYPNSEWTQQAKRTAQGKL